MATNNGFIKPASFSRTHQRAQFTGLNQASERRRGDIVRANNLRAATHVVSGQQEILGSGETLLRVSFPVRFTQMPFFVSSGSLAYGSELVDDNYPVVSGVVAYWDVVEPDARRRWFRGADIAVTASGPESQRLVFSWQFTGMAIANPSGGESSVPARGEQGRVLS